jgi:hypothetical protein
MYKKESGEIVNDVSFIDLEFPANEPKDGKVWVYSEELGNFVQVKDHRGKIYNKKTGEAVVNESLELPDGFTNIAPTRQGQKFNDTKKEWEFDVELLKEIKRKEIEKRYQEEIEKLKKETTHGLIDYWNIFQEEIEKWEKFQNENELTVISEISRYSKYSVPTLVEKLKEESEHVRTALAKLLGKRYAYLIIINRTDENNERTVRELIALSWRD